MKNYSGIIGHPHYNCLLFLGRAYNISVETVSENEISDPTTAQYRTVPWRPHNVSFDPNFIGKMFYMF